MFNNAFTGLVRSLHRAVIAYVILAAGTIVALAVLSAVAPDLATTDAWVHAIIVGAFAVLLRLRLRGVRSGHRSSLRAVGIISGVLVAANVVEAFVPGFAPTWMRVEMIAIALLMAVAVALVIRIVRSGENGVHGTTAVGLPRQ